MKEIFPIEFQYHQQQYFGIVRVRQKETTAQLKVRIMSARIDRLFYGYHIFHIKNNQIITEPVTCRGKAAELRELIQHSIQQHLGGGPERATDISL